VRCIGIAASPHASTLPASAALAAALLPLLYLLLLLLQLWDASDCSCQGVLGQHSSYVTSLCGSGPLVASSCASELKLWEVASRSCLYTVPIGLQLPTPSTLLPGGE
jgi:hypothetical protein